MNEIQNKKRMLIIITCCAVIIIGFFNVFYFSRGRYVRAQELDCEDYDYYNLTMADLERMPFITSIINAGDGAHEHPKQALLDSYAIRERLGSVTGKKVVIVGDILHSRVALSNIFALQIHGAGVMVCGPKTLIPKYIDKLGVKVETNLRSALNWCDVANMLRVQNERMDISFFPSTREYTQQFGVNKELLDSLDKEITIMHQGPINHGVEITSDIAESRQAIIEHKVQHGVASRTEVIYVLSSNINH